MVFKFLIQFYSGLMNALESKGWVSKTFKTAKVKLVHLTIKLE